MLTYLGSIKYWVRKGSEGLKSLRKPKIQRIKQVRNQLSILIFFTCLWNTVFLWLTHVIKVHFWNTKKLGNPPKPKRKNGWNMLNKIGKPQIWKTLELHCQSVWYYLWYNCVSCILRKLYRHAFTLLCSSMKTFFSYKYWIQGVLCLAMLQFFPDLEIRIIHDHF